MAANFFKVCKSHRGGDDPGVVERDGDVGVGDVLLLAEAPLDVEQEVVRVREVAGLLDLDDQLAVEELAVPQPHGFPPPFRALVHLGLTSPETHRDRRRFKFHVR